MKTPKNRAFCSHLFNEREIVRLDIQDIDPNFALTIKVILAAQETRLLGNHFAFTNLIRFLNRGIGMS